MSICIQIHPQPVSENRVKKQGVSHTLVQDNEGKYTCYYCEFTSLKKSTVSEHITRLHPKAAGRQINPFSCSYCGVRFQNKSAELHHVKTHHEIKMTTCPYDGCSYESKITTTLCVHYVRKHMSEQTIPTETSDVVECIVCKKHMKKGASYYHVAKCSPQSPFFIGSEMCDGTEEIVLFKPVFTK